MKTIKLVNEDNTQDTATFYASIVEDFPMVKVYVSEKVKGADFKVLTDPLFVGSLGDYINSVQWQLHDHFVDLGVIDVDECAQESINRKVLNAL